MFAKMEDSGEKYSLQENRFLCVQLDYPRIVSHLVHAGVITPEQSTQTQEDFPDNAERMEELVSTLIKLNTREAFVGFHGALLDSGELELAKKLQADFDCSSMERRCPLPDLPTEIWNKIMGFLPTNDKLNARLVSKAWNSIITEYHVSGIRMRFNRDERMVHFVSRGHNFSFRRKLSKFVFQVYDDRRLDEDGKFVSRAFYKAFFVEYGLNINWLELSGPCEDLVAFIFSPEIQPYLRNVKTLRWFNTYWCEILDRLPNETFSCLSGLEYLFLPSLLCGDAGTECTQVLSKLLANGRQLKGLIFESKDYYYRTGHGGLGASLANLDLGALEMFICAPEQSLNSAAWKSLTASGTGGKLKEICIRPYYDVEYEDIPNFLSSHRHTLARIQMTLWRTSEVNLAAFPRLDALQHLCVERISRGNGTASFLSFCTQAPNLKSLELKDLSLDGTTLVDLTSRTPPFQHMSLETLKITLHEFSPTSIHPEFQFVLGQVPLCFPALSKVVLDLGSRQRDWAWPPLIGPLVLEPFKPGHNWAKRTYRRRATDPTTPKL